MFEIGAILGPVILINGIKDTISESNRPIRIILSLIGCIPQNKPYRVRLDWNFNLPKNVIKIYEENSLCSSPNSIAYDWLMNQKNGFDEKEKEELIENAKYWSYFIFLLYQNNKFEEKLYNDIQELITNCIINL